jgi:hypothetical protein
MSEMAVTSIGSASRAVPAAAASSAERRAALRGAANELVGATFFSQMLKMARNSSLKCELGHGGHGEEIFGAQLDQELARRAALAMRNSLSEAIYKRYAGKV